MERFNNILLFCNFETKQNQAVDRAVFLAAQNQVQLTVIAVVKDIPASMAMAITAMAPQEIFQLVVKSNQDKVDALVRDIKKQGVNAKSIVATGTSYIEIIRQVLRDKHDLVILASEGKGSIKDRLFGNISMHLMRKCPCPVWVVKPAKRTKYKKIMAAVDVTGDFSENQEPLNPLIIQLASSLAKMDHSEFHIVQAWSIYGEDYMRDYGNMNDESLHELNLKIKREITSRLDQLLSAEDLNEVVSHRHMPKDIDAAKAIIKITKNKAIDLLVMGTVCRTGLTGFMIGNTAEKVLSEVNCSVLTLKPEGFVTPVTLEDG